jgi:hypothetical protein
MLIQTLFEAALFEQNSLAGPGIDQLWLARQ